MAVNRRRRSEYFAGDGAKVMATLTSQLITSAAAAATLPAAKLAIAKGGNRCSGSCKKMAKMCIYIRFNVNNAQI